MRTLQIALGVLVACMVAVGCTRENEIIEPVEPPKSGKGGKSKLLVSPKHHGKDIGLSKVYIRYNTLVRPPDGLYDDSMNVVQADGINAARFDSLKWGNYYLYCRGFDPAVQLDVTGESAFTVVDSNQRTYTTLLSVTEVNGINH